MKTMTTGRQTAKITISIPRRESFNSIL